MKQKLTKRVFLLALMLAAIAVTAFAQASIWVNGYLASNKAQRGKIVQAAVVMDIPEGYHINSNKPLGKYAIPTALEIKAPAGVKIGPVGYPRSIVRRFKFSEEQLAVYEGRAVLRFNVSVPADFALGATELRARLRYQSCTDEVCFPPASREVTIPLEVVNATDPVKRINSTFFGAAKNRN
ncbi:MAG TPA: protein-disulfide reductase DsbD N-terminal domain-containing protein [Pyrinomonadaceae bacterium]|jgi:DsbC/DsbD-like thiol-disulfide interchange protein|nr:protein-disulfide reductase DsbD N-terminal domain-containing protein [Pyrinomonadaceae bacterium]